MSNKEMIGIVIPRITKDADTVYLSSSYQANTAFEDSSNVFFFPVKGEEENEEPEEKESEPELFEELDYYFEHLNDGRPFFMACDPESADLMKELVISGYMKERPEFFSRMIAVYAEGYSVSEEDSGKKLFKKQVKISEGGSDLGVIVTTASGDLKEDIDTRLTAWQSKGKLRIPEPVKMLPKLIMKPVTYGPDFVKKRHLGASFLAIGLHALTGAFFVISLFQSINTATLNLLLDLGNKVSEGLYSLTGLLHEFFENTLIKLISMIPGIGEALGSSLDSASGAGLDHVARYFSLEVSNFLSKLYDVIELPKGLGFALGLLASFAASMLMVLMIKFLMTVTSHPMRKKGQSLALAAIRSMIAIPFIILSAVLAMFSPILGLLVYNLVFVFEMVYIFGLLIRNADARSADRLCFIYPFFVFIALGISALAIGIVCAGAGVTIYLRFSDFINVLFGTSV